MTTPTTWVTYADLLWSRRRLLARVTVLAFLLGLGISFVIPKQYESSTSIMPPDQQGASSMLLAAITSRTGGLGGLASGLLGHMSTTALFIELLRSGTVAAQLTQRFHLQQVYHTRYIADTAKRLAHRTKIVDDKKSGIITITVRDSDPVRARDMAQAYLDELNNLVMRTNTSTAHQERVFIERRLQSVRADLEKSQLDLSDFSSKNSTVDIKEQARAMVDATARVQGQMLAEQSSLDSLLQLYGDSNVRVREAQAQIRTLQRELGNMNGSSAPLTAQNEETADSKESNHAYPSLRQLPRLAVPYADLYRRVRVQETVFELLTQQDELARIEEAKDVPVVSVIDPPGIPEKKSFPPRLLLTLLFVAFALLVTSYLLVLEAQWSHVTAADPRKLLAQNVVLRLLQLPLLRMWAHRGAQ